MKKLYIAVGAILMCNFSFAQVGINTTTPLGVFHVDPYSNTEASGLSGTDDDFIITKEGNVGVGTVTPTANLDIRGKIRIGNASSYKQGTFLRTNPTYQGGNVTWDDYPKMNKKFAYGVKVTPDLTLNTPAYTGTYIDLNIGKWMISFTCTYKDENNPNYIIWQLSTSSSSVVPYNNDATKSTAYSCASIKGFHTSVTCYFLVEHSVETTYYFWAQLQNSTPQCFYTGEWKLYAIPLS